MMGFFIIFYAKLWNICPHKSKSMFCVSITVNVPLSLVIQVICKSCARSVTEFYLRLHVKYGQVRIWRWDGF